MSELQHIVGGSSKDGLSLVDLARFRFGRVLLWFGAAFLTLASFNTRQHDPVLLFVAFVFVLFALVGHFVAARRKRAARASMRNTLALLAFVLVALVGALWLVFRRKKKALPDPPTQDEIDALIRGAEA